MEIRITQSVTRILLFDYCKFFCFHGSRVWHTLVFVSHFCTQYYVLWCRVYRRRNHWPQNPGASVVTTRSIWDGIFATAVIVPKVPNMNSPCGSPRELATGPKRSTRMCTNRGRTILNSATNAWWFNTCSSTPRATYIDTVNRTSSMVWTWFFNSKS